MYRFWRDTHLVTGLLLSGALLVLALSSVRFAHPGWFHQEPRETRFEVPVDPAQAATPRALARYLMKNRGWRGELADIRHTDTELRLRVRRMGRVYEVRYARGAATAQVVEKRFGLIRTLLGMHLGFGLHHQYWLHNLWGVWMLVASLGFFLLGGSGIYLWFRLRAERRVGAWLLGGHLAVGLGLILLIWTA